MVGFAKFYLQSFENICSIRDTIKKGKYEKTQAHNHDENVKAAMR